jgi:hypothetical protein
MNAKFWLGNPKDKNYSEDLGTHWRIILDVRGCIQKFPDWSPGAKTANGTALCH